MNNTPETAKAERMAWAQEYMVDTEFARNLERERDEARTELDMWRDGNIMHQIHRDELEKTERERDEAREAAHSFRSLYYAKSGINKGGCAFPWEGAK
jgi:hypothetical protein